MWSGSGTWGTGQKRKRAPAGATDQSMTHTYRAHFFHFIWSTKGREPWISKEIQERLYNYIAGIIKQQNAQLLAIGGIADHVHLLVRFEDIEKLSFFIRDIKANSSLWISKNFPDRSSFEWQQGYGSFTVSSSNLEKVKTYIHNQEEHHQKVTFAEEYCNFLKKHGIQYDERFVLG